MSQAEETLVPGGMAYQNMREANRLARQIRSLLRGAVGSGKPQDEIWINCGILNASDVYVGVTGGSPAMQPFIRRGTRLTRWTRASTIDRLWAFPHLVALEARILAAGPPRPDPESLEGRLQALDKQVAKAINTGLSLLDAWGVEASVRLKATMACAPSYTLAYGHVDMDPALTLSIAEYRSRSDGSRSSIGVTSWTRLADWTRQQRVDAAKVMPDLLIAARQAAKMLLRDAETVDAAVAAILTPNEKDKQ